MPLSVPEFDRRREEITRTQRNIKTLEEWIQRERNKLAELQMPINTLQGPFKVTS